MSIHFFLLICPRSICNYYKPFSPRYFVVYQQGKESDKFDFRIPFHLTRVLRDFRQLVKIFRHETKLNKFFGKVVWLVTNKFSIHDK